MGLFKRARPTSPIDDDMMRWVDGRFAWLQSKLGETVPRTVPVICPTPVFFPDLYNGTDRDAAAIFNRVVGYMGVDRQSLDLELYGGEDTGVVERGSLTAGLYLRGDQQRAERSRILINRSQLANPMSFVATAAHEIGHELLLGRGLIRADAQDHEPLTDLMTVFLGLGIFSANSTIEDRTISAGTRTGWSIKRLGYLDQRTFGYALARFAYTRQETSPGWAKHLRPDVRSPMKQSLRFLSS